MHCISISFVADVLGSHTIRAAECLGPLNRSNYPIEQALTEVLSSDCHSSVLVVPSPGWQFLLGQIDAKASEFYKWSQDEFNRAFGQHNGHVALRPRFNLRQITCS
ncbi:unnamed protein product [Durusdinium trenchii]|uniref:Uncharacterized protein n=1 Tax=Durusdinium trenchii TaxID=1381693 RepID=A0ABP0HN58_9DINO